MLDKAFIFADVHANKKGLLRSLEQGAPAEMVIGLGDYIDRGPDNRGTLDELKRLREEYGDRATFLVGNHEIMIQRCLHTEDCGDVWHWIKNGGYSFLREVARDCGYRTEREIPEFPVEVCNGEFMDSIQTKWVDRVKKRELENLDLGRAFLDIKEMVLSGAYANLFQSLKIMAEVRKCCWLVHADVSQCYAELGVEFANESYAIQQRDHFADRFSGIHDLVDTHSNQSPGIYDVDVCRELWSSGVNLVIHGHTPNLSGRPYMRKTGHVFALDLDTGIGLPQYPSEWAYAKILADGTVIVESSVTGGQIIIGRINDDNVFIPSDNLRQS